MSVRFVRGRGARAFALVVSGLLTLGLSSAPAAVASDGSTASFLSFASSPLPSTTPAPPTQTAARPRPLTSTS